MYSVQYEIYINRLENIIERIFHSLDTISPTSIKVKYIGNKNFDEESIDQYCFKFEKMNSQHLWFELLIPTNNHTPHDIDLNTFSNQIIYKYNLENIANYISTPSSQNTSDTCHFKKEYIFEVTCQSNNQETNVIYVNMEPNNFFN